MTFIMSFCTKTSLLIVLTVFIIHGYALPFDRFDVIKTNKHPKKNLFKMISDITFDNHDITAMYKDVTVEERTANCPGNCRTAIALWVLQSVYPCKVIQKRDCSRGLVCCVRDKKIEKVRSASVTKNSTVIHPWDTEIEMNPLQFSQDPIPGDSEEVEIIV